MVILARKKTLFNRYNVQKKLLNIRVLLTKKVKTGNNSDKDKTIMEKSIKIVYVHKAL